MERIKAVLTDLYEGDTVRGRRFRYTLLAFDLVVIVYFVATSFFRHTAWVTVVDFGVGFFVAADFAARLFIAPDRRAFFLRLTTWIDILIIIALAGPVLSENLLFLRVMRAMRILRSYHVLRDLRRMSAFFLRNEEVFESVINLIVFVFVMTAFVYVLQAPVNPAITNYVDALYFTVTTLTTTGFGDITLTGSSGRVLAVVVMVIGVALFLRLVQTIFRPNKIVHECPDCGLRRHDPDAVHCKHCGRVIHIVSDGN